MKKRQRDVATIDIRQTRPIPVRLRLQIIFVRIGMYRWRDNAHHYRRLLCGAASQQARRMLEELAQEAEAIAEDFDRGADSDAEITMRQVT
jgi:hypothetical protein